MRDEPMYDVVCVGSAVLDVLLKSKSFKLVPSREFAGGIAICETYEGKMEADEIEITSGGGGTNNAVSFVRKGLSTGIVAELGADIAGKMVTAELLREGVDIQHMVTEEGEETGVSVILVSAAGGRSIVTYRGASRMLSHTDFPWKTMKTRWLHISSLGGRMALWEELIRWADKKGVHICVNPGAQELRDRKRLWESVRGVDVLLLNREEAIQLTGQNYLDMKVYRSNACLAGPKVSVITAGKYGGKVCVDGACSFYEGAKIKKVCGVGAGDAFGSGFVAALILGKPIDVATAWGRKNAESVLKNLSAKKGLLHRTSLESSS